MKENIYINIKIFNMIILSVDHYTHITSKLSHTKQEKRTGCIDIQR